jgi:hypothetical protein
MSRNDRQRRERFFAAHPVCCFCGGITPAVEEDHFPSRALFRKRVWPEGYAFPACAKCNRVTSADELVVAMLSRTRGGKQDDAARAEVAKYMAAVRNEFPGLLEVMRPRTHREYRTAQRKYGLILKPDQVSTDLPVFLLSDSRIQNAVRNFARKLGLALYYKHAGMSVPHTGGVAARWYSNLQVDSDAIPRQLAEILPEFPNLIRGRVELTDQFFYRWGLADTRMIATFLAMFRQSFAIVGFVSADVSDFPADNGPMTARPVYDWTRSDA